MTDKYEKVEGMSVGQVVQLMSEGVEFYRHEAGNLLIIDTSLTGIFIGSNTVSMDLGSLRMELKGGKIYRKIEHKESEMTHKYEKVDLNLVSIFSKRDEFASKSLFWRHEESNEFILIESEYDLMTYGAENNVYVKIKAPWWEKHVGGLVMFSDHDENWCCRVFAKHNGKVGSLPFVDHLGTGWKQMRPLTAAEKDAIITEG